MTQQAHGGPDGGSPAENYQRYFVPAIGAPMADDLVQLAELRPGERVLDVACGTGVVARRAAERVAATGAVAGLDVNPGMLAAARARAPADAAIDWHEASADAMPFPDDAFDVVFCQMGLQFMPDKPAALREIRRVLSNGGRAFVTVPGPRPPLFAVMADGLARHIGPQAAAFVDLVFSMHDVDELAGLMEEAGFEEVDVAAGPKALRLPAPADFLWQYIGSTPIAQAFAGVGVVERDALEREVCERWQAFEAEGSMMLEAGVTTARGQK